MTKRPSQASKTPPRTAQDADQAAHSTPSAERPANRKWRVWASKADLGWWASVRGCNGRGDPNCRCDTFHTWDQAIAHVKRQIRAEQLTKAAHETANAGIPARFFTHVEAGQ